MWVTFKNIFINHNSISNPGYGLFPREARDLDLVRENHHHHHHHHQTTMEEPWETVFWRSEGGTVTQWALRAGISTHAVVKIWLENVIFVHETYSETSDLDETLHGKN